DYYCSSYADSNIFFF
nr:immunoglobulin light chain junction region [Macaca mulatta]MOV71862.1 immunoglobulin light chain junction region [Macaca mulatta]